MTDALADLNEAQKCVVNAVSGPVLVLAGAGSGKTRALTHRIAYLIQQGFAQPDQLLAVTFTNKAAQEMRDRIGKLIGREASNQALISTFHGLGARLLREQHKYLNRSASFSILDTTDSERLIKEALASSGLSARDWSPRFVLHSISAFKNEFLGPNDAMREAKTDQANVMAETYKVYERLLHEHDAYDFDDLLIEPARLLQKSQEVRQFYQRRWRYLSVDEYQDTNPVQNSILHLLLNKEHNLCAVGDDYQAIYSWRGAKVDHILRFTQTFPNAKTIYLTQNYRSSGSILDVANKVISENKEQMHKELWTSSSAGQPVSIMALQSDQAEADWVAQRVNDHIENGGSAGDWAILYRTNAQSRAFEESLMKQGLPYTIIGAVRFYERAEVKDALALLNLLVNPNHLLALQRLARVLLSGIGPKTVEVLRSESKKRGLTLRQIMGDQSIVSPRQYLAFQPLLRAYEKVGQIQDYAVKTVLETLLRTSGYHSYLKNLPDGLDRLANIDELISVAATYKDVRQFVDDTTLLTDQDNVKVGSNTVKCMTLHASKGLEFNNVVIGGCEEQLLPHHNSLESPAQIEEERRLLYVGMTRARKELYISYVRNRSLHGERLIQTPSRFLSDLSSSILKISLDDTPDLLPDHSTKDSVYSSFEVGDLIHHPVFGQGAVIQTHGSLITAVFSNYGVKTLDGTTLASAAV